LTDNLPIKKEDALLFTEKELQEVNDYIDSGKGHKIESKVAGNFYALYKEGRTVEQIHQAFPLWPRGAILLARHQYHWDDLNNKYFIELAQKVKERLTISQLELVNHLMDKLAVVNKEFAKDMENYFQNPIEGNLPSNRIKSTRELKETIAILKEALMLFQAPNATPMLPAASAAPKSTVNITINTKDGSVVTETTEKQPQTETIIDAKVENVDGPVSPTQHSAILKALIKTTKKE
jgi:hypothetical protein